MKVRICTTNVISRAIYTPMRAAIRTENPLGRFRGVRGVGSSCALHAIKCVCTQKLHHIDAKTIFGV